MTSRWNPRAESPVARARRRATLSYLRVGMAGLARRQRARKPRRGAPLPNGARVDASWPTARLLAVNLALLCVLSAVIVVMSNLIERITRQAFFVIFVLLTLFLIRRGTRLRRGGLEPLGRSLTAWAGVTGCLVVVSGALSLELTQFVPELIAVSAGWLLVLGVWKDLPTLVTAAVILVGPIVWGAFVWDRSVVGAVLIVVAALAYARSGSVRRTLFGALVVAGVLVIAATVHQLTHPRGMNTFDGADLLALMIVIVCLVAAGEVESWHGDWAAYGAIVRSVTAAAAIVLAALAARPGQVESLAAGTPASALSRVVVVGIAVMVILWITVMSRPVAAGGRLKVATWSVVIMLLLGALTHAYSLAAIRWVAVVALAMWGLRAMRNGLRRSRAWSVLGGFAVVFGAALPIVAPQRGLVGLAVLLLALAAASGVVAMLGGSQSPPMTALPMADGPELAVTAGVP